MENLIMTEEYFHYCGETLSRMFRNIRKAIVKSVGRLKTECFYKGVTPGKEVRLWAYRENDRIIHPSVLRALKISPPKDLHQLVLEYPHISKDGRLGYTQNDVKGEADIQTVTSPGKYIKRHFPDLADHVIRGLASLIEGYSFLSTTKEMMEAVEEGPRSCMSWDREDGENPYISYSPDLGWKVCVRHEADVIKARALVHEPTKTFVRTYAISDRGVTACNDMQSYLKEQGYSHRSSWPSEAKFLFIDNRVPYLDGDQSADLVTQDGTQYFIPNEDGEYILDNTGGYYSTRSDEDDDDEDDYICECANCSNSIYEGNSSYFIEYHEESRVCHSCVDDHPIVYGRNERQYRTHVDNVVTIDDVDYHEEYLGDQCELRFIDSLNQYVHEEDAFYCEVDDHYHSIKDGAQLIHLVDGRTAAYANSWKCSISGGWYGSDEDSEKVEGGICHPDFLPQKRTARSTV